MNKDYQFEIIDTNTEFKSITLKNIKTQYELTHIIIKSDVIELKLTEYFLGNYFVSSIALNTRLYQVRAPHDTQQIIDQFINNIEFILNSNCFKYIKSLYLHSLNSDTSVYTFKIVEPSILIQLL